ncbi:amidase family protein [Amycolatopsis cihanbeyliensis]|uniref:Mandelamide amidase n=1 Tax=Amycolatopsis cihanbeyliensis TaxID=1128664 RepID=A0A542DJZ9_AMYCI|nr:amidase family protein [Amycolatopsis cihanbeyliensis]TQJ03406.1 mandelamide amidase [Amycolatopsis cihanbeyliensis]
MDSNGLTGLVAALRAGGITSTELTDRILESAREHADLSAYVTLDAERARRAAELADTAPVAERDRPLHGIPVAVKDNIHVAGLPNTAGTPALAEFVPEADAPVVRRLREAGAFVLGKTAMHELAFGITSAFSARPPVRNAVDPRYVAGGSSGGSAVAVACGVPAALGTDTGGSVRIPAALNGVCGLRPSTGRYPGSGVTPLSTSRDTVGPMAGSVAELALLDGVLAADDRPVRAARRPRLGVPRDHFTEPLGPETAVAFAAALDRLREQGVTVLDVPASGFAGAELEIGLPIVNHEARHALAAYLAEYLPALSFAELAERIAAADVRTLFESAILEDAPSAVALADYRAALDQGRGRLRAAYRELFRAYELDALIFPTTPCCAVPVAQAGNPLDLGGEAAGEFPTFIRNTGPGSITGLPGLTIPLAAPGPLPVGLALDGRLGEDRALLGVGLTVQRLLG